MGKRSTQVRSERKLNSRPASLHSSSAAPSSSSRDTMIVISPRNSSTSLTARGFHARSLCTAGFCSSSGFSVIGLRLPNEQLAAPVERAFLPQIDVARQQHHDVQQHLAKTEPAQFAKDVCPGVQEYRFDVEQNEDHRHKLEFHREGLPRVARRLHAALIRFLLGPVWPPPPHQT